MNRVLAAIVSVILFSQLAPAQSREDGYRQQVSRYANNSNATKSMIAYGFRDHALNVGYIVDTPGTSFDVLYRLKRGFVYAFIGVCDSDCIDVNLTIYGPAGNKVGEHISSDNNPSVWMFIVEDGDYRVRATIPKCNAPIGCYVAIKGMYK